MRTLIGIGATWWFIAAGALFAADAAYTATGAKGNRDGDWVVTTRLFPLIAGVRMDNNVYRRTAGDPEGDIIQTFGGGVSLSSLFKDTWQMEVDYHFSADLYQRHGDLNNYRNHLLISLDSRQGPVLGWFRKKYMIRRSPENNYDYWDDQIALGIDWSPRASWNLDLQGENTLRRYYDPEPFVRAKDFNDNTVTLTLFRQLEDGLSLQAGGFLGRREFNRYATGLDGGGYHVLRETQKDDTYGGQAGMRWFVASVLNELFFQVQKSSSNNVGSGNHVRSISWAAGVNPAPTLTFQMMFRLYHKRYDVDPLTIPEYQLGFNDEEGQDLLTAKTVWECTPRLNLGFSFARVRCESSIPAKYYIKQVYSLQIQRRF